MQRLRTTIGLWSRLTLASTVAALAFAALLILEFAMATLLAWILMVILLPLLAVSLAVLAIVGMVFVPAWIVLALAYRWLRPAPLIAGRISHDGMADALERVAYQLTHPDDFLRAFLRAGGMLLGLSFCLTLMLGGGIVALSVSPQLTEWRLAVVAGTLTVVVTTIAVVYAELRDGASVERTIADQAAVEITGDPAALASALETLGDDLPRRPTTDVRGYRSTAAFSIVPPPWEEYRFFDRTRRFVRRRLFGTHPPTGKRIERLRRTIDD